MSYLTGKQIQKLAAMGQEPINLPNEIWFNGDERLQKTPGPWHLEEYRSTGTYNHPDVKRMRERTLRNTVKRLSDGGMNKISLKKFGGFEGLMKKCEENGIKVREEKLELLRQRAILLEDEYAMYEQSRLDEVKAEPVSETLQKAEHMEFEANLNKPTTFMKTEDAGGETTDAQETKEETIFD